MIRVLLADDHEIVRLGLRSVLEEAEDIKVVAEVATAEGAIATAQAGGIDVILMDLRFGAGAEGQRVTTGAQATAAIRANMTNPPKVLVVTNYDTDADILGAIEAGAVGYMLKDAEPDQLVGAIRAAARGESALAPAVQATLMGNLRTGRQAHPDTELSPREHEVREHY